ncbi:CDP-glycerol glycerophosphotransferase family protein [Virgibacillus salinus]|uniref:CDP-glycerol glycerophosphotransferase, TagB/SpsB family n=1 Tax=Virgibacillus salinus TaxID=553311 RepID=A0A1H0YHM0_9BACI|nr:CDP-glycerol glycerophosphotransferase family protein [Virgibacillus salinus]SDQ14396.1 CDP-glycerol glycerophosphotransferase, TagB/SpsB family [Virgibacillus salinus]
MNLYQKLVQIATGVVHKFMDSNTHEYNVEFFNDGNNNISLKISSNSRLPLIRKYLVLKKSDKIIANYQLHRESSHYRAKIPYSDFENFPDLEKVSFFIKSHSKENQLVVKELLNSPDNSAHKIIHNQFFTEVYTTKNNALVMRTTKFIKKNVIKKLPNLVENILVSDNYIRLDGWAPVNSIPINTITLVVRHRKTNQFYEFPVTKLNQNSWASTVYYEDIDINEGTWDFFLLVNGSGYFRVKCKNSSLVESSTFINSTEKESGINSFYLTKYGSLSLVNERKWIELSTIDSAYTKDSIFIMEGVIESDLFDTAQVLKEFQIELRNRRTGKYSLVPLDVQRNLNNSYDISFSLDYNNIIPFNESMNSKWDVYISFIMNGKLGRLRVHYLSDAITKLSRYQFHHYNLHQIYFYSTIQKNLSISLSKLTIIRNVENCIFDKEKLLLKGYAYINTIEWKNENDLKRYIIIRDRQTNKELKLPLEGHLNYHEANQHQYYYSGFDISIDTRDLNDLSTSSFDNTFDLIIQFDYQGGSLEKKVGSQDFQYYRDGHLDKTTTKYNNLYILTYLRYTPFGNLKLETLKYSEENYNLLTSRHIQPDTTNEIWLIGERPDTAQDTGYHFFKYCRENYPDLEIYYVISADSKDRTNIEHLGNVLYLGSTEHIKKTKMATTFIGSHELEYFLPSKGNELPSFKNGKRVFLQHGILGRKKVEYDKKNYKIPFNLVCVSSSAEKELVVNELGYNESEVAITGLSRFDNLLKNNQKKKEILVIPTWREWLYSGDSFLSSEYFKRYKNLLQNEELHQLLEKYDITLNFFPHYRMQTFIEHFEALSTKHINIIGLADKKVQDLLLESSLMITDYSSVSFDFNYMSKPVIFYHFDFDKFFRNGILRSPEDTFLGDIRQTETSVVESIKKYITANFEEDPIISKNKLGVFDNIDTNNNKRIFNEIKNDKK